MLAGPRILVYLLRRDLRLEDNPVFHEVSVLYARQQQQQQAQQQAQQQQQQPPPPLHFTHLLPLYILPVQQVEVSGFLASPAARSPYPEARSRVAGFWRCGPHRARFLAESVWALKTRLEGINSSSTGSSSSSGGGGGRSGLEIRIGRVGEVISALAAWCARAQSGGDSGDGGSGGGGKLVGVWMTRDEGVEERREEREARRAAAAVGADFRLFADEKYFVDE
jgi:deoxyribodipyrimidine photo-lyase